MQINLNNLMTNLNMNVFSLFPTPVFTWENILPEKELNSIDTSLGNDTLQKHIDIPSLKEFIHNKAMKDIFITLGIDKNYTVEITEMWGNILNTGDDHQYHSHPNNVYSGIYYVTGGNPTNFVDPRTTNGLQVKQSLNDFSAKTVSINATPNTLIIFDSWLKHFVLTNKTTVPRKTISFNILLRGEYGKEGSYSNVRI